MKYVSAIIMVCLLVAGPVFATEQHDHDEAGTINGSVYCDKDGDGECTCSEEGLGDIHVQLFTTQCGGIPVQTIHTDGEGNYSFHVPKPGHYYVMVDLDYVCGGRVPTTETCLQVDLAAGDTVTLEPFGYSSYGK